MVVECAEHARSIPEGNGKSPAAGQTSALPTSDGFPENGRTNHRQTIGGTLILAVGTSVWILTPAQTCRVRQFRATHLRYDGGVAQGLDLSGRLGFGAAVMAALVLLAAAEASRAQGGTSAPSASATRPLAQAPGGAPGQPSGQSPPPPVTTDTSHPAAPAHSQHSVTVTFDYDFGLTPACSKKITKACVQRFVAYDISAGAGHSAMLFQIPLPANPAGAVHGIVATSPKLDFESGRHLVSVTAQGPDGRQSRKSVCTTWITIP